MSLDDLPPRRGDHWCDRCGKLLAWSELAAKMWDCCDCPPDEQGAQ